VTKPGEPAHQLSAAFPVGAKENEKIEGVNSVAFGKQLRAAKEMER
jgi:hypothetical protein